MQKNCNGFIEPYVALANAIVMQACIDYRSSMKMLIKVKKQKETLLSDGIGNHTHIMDGINRQIISCNQEIESCVKFFGSKQAKVYTTLDLMYVKRKIDEELGVL